jgi:AcrR family transcriptional regulator
VLVEAALGLAADGGPEDISVREAARRAGVSPGAPFRHFASREALMAAVAEEAQRRFHVEIAAALAEVPSDDPLQQFSQFGRAYLRWALHNPAHFEIISTGRYFDHDGAGALSADNAALIAMTGRMLAEAQASGRLRPVDLKTVQIAGRALVYGFARMAIDGHLPRWGVSADEIERRGEQAIDLFLDGIARQQLL